MLTTTAQHATDTHTPSPRQRSGCPALPPAKHAKTSPSMQSQCRCVTMPVLQKCIHPPPHTQTPTKSPGLLTKLAVCNELCCNAAVTLAPLCWNLPSAPKNAAAVIQNRTSQLAGGRAASENRQWPHCNSVLCTPQRQPAKTSTAKAIHKDVTKFCTCNRGR